MNVLIVEENADDRKLLRQTLEHHGCTVIEARDEEEGLELAMFRHPDIIVSDALMPRMDGFQLLRELKADPYLKSIPFLFYSATYTSKQKKNLPYISARRLSWLNRRNRKHFGSRVQCLEVPSDPFMPQSGGGASMPN